MQLNNRFFLKHCQRSLLLLQAMRMRLSSKSILQKSECADIKDLYYQHDNIGPEGSPVVFNTPEQMEIFLDKDLELFKKWMADREILSALLKKKVREVYDSNTAYWKHTQLQEYQGHYINK